LTGYPSGVYIKKMKNKKLIRRLNIVKGQIDGLARIMENEEDCSKVSEQFYAINSALKKVMEIYFKENLTSCLRSVNLKKKRTIDFLLKEIIKNK
jgi:DNA-binding FrmR family transcriptional regulator